MDFFEFTEKILQSQQYQQTYSGGKDLVTPDGIFYGIKRTLIPILDTVHPSNVLKPGDQLTQK